MLAGHYSLPKNNLYEEKEMTRKKSFSFMSVPAMMFAGIIVLVLSGCVMMTPTRISSIPPGYFEQQRKQGDRLVYVTMTINRDKNAKPDIAGTERTVTDINAAVLPAPDISEPSTDLDKTNHVYLSDKGLAVFSLPKNQDKIGLAFEWSNKHYAGKGAVEMPDKITHKSAHTIVTIPPKTGDFFINVEFNGEHYDIKVLDNPDAIKNALAQCRSNPYGEYASTDRRKKMPDGKTVWWAPGFIPAPTK
jgi:hypothetical protein